jgi:hypothetical protein
MKKPAIFNNPLTTGLCWGVIGGLTLVLIEYLMPNALVEKLPYVLFLILAVLTIKLTDADNKYLKLFFAALITFMVMFLIVYLYLVLVLNPNGSQITLTKHIIQITGMLGIGIISSALLTFLVTRRL